MKIHFTVHVVLKLKCVSSLFFFSQRNLAQGDHRIDWPAPSIYPSPNRGASVEAGFLCRGGGGVGAMDCTHVRPWEPKRWPS